MLECVGTPSSLLQLQVSLMLKRKIFMSKQPNDVQYTFSVIIRKFYFCRRYRFIAYRQLVGWCWGWLGRREWYSQAVLSTKLGLAFHPLAMLDSNIHTFKSCVYPVYIYSVNNIICAQPFYTINISKLSIKLTSAKSTLVSHYCRDFFWLFIATAETFWL